MAKFKNLEAEMVRYGFKNEDISKRFKITPHTVRRKLSGEIGTSIEEAKVIKEMFAQKGAEFTIDYLFAE